MNVPFLGDRLHVKKIEERRKDIMDYVKAFVVGGIICAIVQILDRKSTRLNSSHRLESRMPSSA